ncbi:hypothetical protein JDV02_007047 [Purpureocillium takamizusanense]|uniref:BTB domain-containing protein n=1 Tax=Purpureocillium takamizusanense TaxID=2060973 RepID=A0A9Q8QLN1_9HYPO|nr:uncharacterized protein JDV02_007047 [Purpureocillium takamizusanense]UNI21014.1 hypothetical protein JDV02_007047 [Purpureocillium takamizusanense]
MAVPLLHSSSCEQARRRKHLLCHSGSSTGSTGLHSAIHGSPGPAALQAHVLATVEPFPPGTKSASYTPSLRMTSRPGGGLDNDTMAGRSGTTPRVSLDGRSKRALSTLIGKDDWPKPQLLQSREPVNLREASPPKTNPWSRTPKIASPTCNESTLSTPDLTSWPTPDDSRIVPSAKSPPSTSYSGPTECCSEASPASNAGSDDKALGGILEASKGATAEVDGQGTPGDQAGDGSEKERDEWQDYQMKAPTFADKDVKYWLWRTGACADVILHLDDTTYFCHREILITESGYFRDNLPLPSSQGAPVEVALVTHGPLNSHCLQFLYTGQLEVLALRYDNDDSGLETADVPDTCQFPEASHGPSIPRGHGISHVQDISHVPMCALFYIQALGLRAPSLAGHVVQLLEQTTKRWGDVFDSTLQYCLMTDRQAKTFSAHLQNALYTTYSYADSAALAPLRLAVAGFLDAVFPVVARQDKEVDLFSTREWHTHGARITADMYWSRRLRESPGGLRSAAEDIKALWEQCEEHGGLRNPVPLEMVRIPPLDDII